MNELFECRNGHGAMELQPGWYGLPGYRFTEGVEGQRLAAKTPIVLSGHHFLVRLWRCPVCKLIDLHDEEVA